MLKERSCPSYLQPKQITLHTLVLLEVLGGSVL